MVWLLGSNFLATYVGVIYKTKKCKVQNNKVILWLLKVFVMTCHIPEIHSCPAHMYVPLAYTTTWWLGYQNNYPSNKGLTIINSKKKSVRILQ
jgi:hypothetical protein